MSDQIGQIKLDDGKIVQFGDRVEYLERILGCDAKDKELPISRAGVDLVIEIPEVTLDFDSGRFCGITFRTGYQYLNAPEPYPEVWKNFCEIDGRKVFSRMPRAEFIQYLEHWEERARELDAKKAGRGDLLDDDYSISTKVDKFFDMIHISLGPSRRAGGGGLWSDGWTAFFGEIGDRSREGPRPLMSLSAFRDEFNTVARRKT